MVLIQRLRADDTGRMPASVNPSPLQSESAWALAERAWDRDSRRLEFGPLLLGGTTGANHKIGTWGP